MPHYTPFFSVKKAVLDSENSRVMNYKNKSRRRSEPSLGLIHTKVFSPCSSSRTSPESFNLELLCTPTTLTHLDTSYGYCTRFLVSVKVGKVSSYSKWGRVPQVRVPITVFSQHSSIRFYDRKIRLHIPNPFPLLTELFCLHIDQQHQ